MRPLARTLLLVVWSLPVLCAAQEEQEEKISSGGLRGGLALSTLMGGGSDLTVRSGFYGGVYINVIKVPIYSLSLGLEYETAGDRTDHRLSYLNLPLDNRIRLGPVYFDGGVDVGYKLTESVQVDDNSGDGSSDAKADPWNFRWHAGGGIKLFFIGVEARYQNGLNQVYPGLRNASLQLGLSVGF